MSNDNANTVSLLSSPGRGAIAVVRVAGPAALETLRHCLASGSPPATIDRHRFARWRHPTGSEDVVLVTRSPSEFEVCTHGGVLAAELVCEQLQSLGFSRIFWQDAWRSQDPHPWRVAAQIAAVDGLTLKAADWLLANAEELPQLIDQLHSRHRAGDTHWVWDRAKQLIARSRLGEQIRFGWNVVIAGRTNVGKSTLFNRILGYERAIVYDQPGSTRDVVSEQTAIDGWPVTISDTAGLRETLDMVEQMGVARAEQAAAGADLIVLVSDRSQPWHSDEQALLTKAAANIVVVVHNKSDLTPDPALRPVGIQVSLADTQSIAPILTEISRHLFSEAQQFAPFPTDPWQLEVLRQFI